MEGDRTLRVTVTQMKCDNKTDFEQDWNALLKHVEEMQSQLVILPEMPFYSWVCATPQYTDSHWIDSVHAHEDWFNLSII